MAAHTSLQRHVRLECFLEKWTLDINKAYYFLAKWKVLNLFGATVNDAAIQYIGFKDSIKLATKDLSKRLKFTDFMFFTQWELALALNISYIELVISYMANYGMLIAFKRLKSTFISKKVIPQ